jgi:hypothetical protein
MEKKSLCEFVIRETQHTIGRIHVRSSSTMLKLVYVLDL